MFNFRKQFHSTKLKVYQKSQEVMSNSSIVLEKISQLIDGGITTLMQHWHEILKSDKLDIIRINQWT